MKQPHLFAEPERDADRTRKLLAALGGLGLGNDLVSVLADFGGVKPQTNGFESELDAMRFLRGPLIVHASPWMADIPKWMPAQALAERSEIVLGDSPLLVGPTELAAVTRRYEEGWIF